MPPPSNRSLLDEATDGSQLMDDGNEPPAKRRRVFLQTMGHQLREIGMLRDRTSETAGGSFSQSPRPASISQSVTDAPSGHPQVQIQTPESDAVPGEDDHLPIGVSMSAAKALWNPVTEVLVAPVTDGGHIFSYDDLRAWTDSYFDHWHLAYPFLDALSVLEFFDQIVHDGITETEAHSSQQMVILRSIMSISLADRRQMESTMRPVPSQLVFSSVDDAMKSVQCFLTEESSIVALQAVGSVQLFLLSMLRYNAASRLGGLAVRMSFHLGLHRCPVQYSTFPVQEAQLRQRIFWSIYCMDRYICIRLGVPLAIRDADTNVCFPGSERHGSGDPRSFDGDARLDLLRFLARLAEIRGSIMELRNKFVSYRQSDVDDAVGIDADLTKWWNEVDEYLESNSTNSSPIYQQHQVTLTVLRHESIIALNKHILATSKKSSSYNAALQNCIGAARSIISTLHKTLAPGMSLENPAVQNNGPKPAIFWPSFTWAVWMSAFIMIYAANEDQVSQDVSIRLADRALDVMRNLKLRGSMWPDACAAAIRDLRAQLVIRRNRSKHTHINENNTSRVMQDRESGRTALGPINQQSPNDVDGRDSPSFSARTQNLRSAPGEAAHFRDSRRGPPSGQSIGSVKTPANTQADSGSSFTYGSAEGGVSNPSHPLSNQPNTITSEPPPGYSIAGANDYAYRVGAQLESELQIQNYEGLEFFYGLDAPFGAEGDGWRNF
ncbi:fungal-specific transcription factor domain-containing protein [Leptodontidium sp. MPI-SDFR-AT-0119]|nr:fungal-specific transcription factor domain-containing protein [Leptodontidium sp. MPI-SDFR-AT-0119]